MVIYMWLLGLGGNKHLYPALPRQQLGWSSQASPATVRTNTWSQIPLPSGSARETFVSENKHDVCLADSPKKLENIQTSALIPCAGWQLYGCDKISQAEVSELWVSHRGTDGSSSDQRNQQQQRGSRDSNGSSWRKQRAACCHLKWLWTSASRPKFVFPYSCC